MKKRNREIVSRSRNPDLSSLARQLLRYEMSNQLDNGEGVPPREERGIFPQEIAFIAITNSLPSQAAILNSEKL